MPLIKPCMDHELLAVGSWADDRALDQSSAMRSRQKKSDKQHIYPSAEPHKGSRSEKTESAGSSRQDCRNQNHKSEDELHRLPLRDAIKAFKKIQAAQVIQRQYPTYSVKTEGGQRGNEATAKPSGSLSRVDRRLLKQAGTYLLSCSTNIK